MRKRRDSWYSSATAFGWVVSLGAMDTDFRQGLKTNISEYPHVSPELLLITFSTKMGPESFSHSTKY